jgi:hypothetical protein
MKNKATLIIIFNHKYNRNINVLRQIYSGRFSNIYFLVPFYEGTDADVIPVYENSYFFQGYIAQGFRTYTKESNNHYLFIGDDLILNPDINEDNYVKFFRLAPDENFIPEVFSLHNFTNNNTLDVTRILTTEKGRSKYYWGRTRQAYYYSPNKRGIEVKGEIPDYAEAEKRLKLHGFAIEPLRYNDMFGGIKPGTSLTYKALRLGKLLLNAPKLSKKFFLPYPLVASYSDIVIVSKDTLPKFVDYCGVFAANKLFVEMAIPTALLLASDKVTTEPQIGKKGVLYWNYGEERKAKYKSDMQQYNFELHQLLKCFPAGKLYIHPIKLSKWKVEL